ncbi:MAG TPA: methyltransferase domain-containing protein [Victivallales bacterium]|nr:methyltransferase domain-containing protein [Victivallales bacterium]
MTNDGIIYPFIRGHNNLNIPNFLIVQEHGEAAKQALVMYDHKSSTKIYRNFLDWLFLTFDEDESIFRANLLAKLKLQKGYKVLITGCGLGDDIRQIIDVIGSDGVVHANDLAAEMVVAASHYVMLNQPNSKNIFLSVCDAQNLPFSDNYFDAAFHFGGINLFDNIKLSIEEMERVVRPGGRVVFGDEGVAPWLRNIEYGRIAINNNSLWAATAPLDLLPRYCMDVHLSWVLGNCFYVIDFEVSDSGPYMNKDMGHKGTRGGSMRTRYFGQLEGVTEESKNFVLEDAERKGISIHDWLEQVINEKKQL